jgi:iron complex outermembrane receptor protein
MIKRVFLFSKIVLAATASFAEGEKGNALNEKITTITTVVKVTFSGKITDAKTGESLPGASIYIADVKLGAIADRDGKYFFRDIPTGHHLIEVSHAGYSSIIEHIDLDKDTEKDFALQPSVVENQGVIITGVSNATSIRKAPVPITSIRKTEFLQSAANNIIDALAKKPGVSQLGTGPGISKPVIRGLGYNRVVVINEGVRQEGQQWGDEHGIEIDELSVARAEIVKGPASLIYGSDALAGVINLITNIPAAEGTIKGNFLTNFQTNNDLFGLNGNIAGNKKGINWNLYGTYKSAGDYENRYDGRVLNSRFNEKNFGGYIGVNKSWGFSHLIFSSFNQNAGLVEGDRDDATGRFLLFAGSPLERIATNTDLNSKRLFIPRQNIKHYKIVSDNNFIINKSRLKLNLGFQNNLRKEFGNPEDEKETELYFDLQTFNYNIQFVLPEMKEWHTSVGVNGLYQINANKGEEVIIPEYSFFDAGGFIYTQRFFKKATLSGGIRFDNRSVNSKEFLDGAVPKFEAFKINFSNISGSAGFSYEPSEFLTLKVNVARGFRAPNMAELASNGAHEGTNRYEYGDKNLKSETSLQLDGGFQVDYEHFSLGLSVFYNRINDFIFYRKLESVFGGDSLVNLAGEDLVAFRFQQYDAKLSGLEVNIDIHPHPLDWLHFENSVSLVRGRFDERIGGTDNLPLIPAPRLLSELRADFKKAGKTLRNFYVKAEMERSFIQNKLFFAFDTETSTPAYTLLNAGIGADIVSKKGNPVCSFHLFAINLTNEVYQHHLSRLKYTDENTVTGRRGIFNTGRNFSFKMNIPLQFSEK